MICFRDMAFTTDPKCICHRKLTDEVRSAAEKWWGKPGAPIQVKDKCDCYELQKDQPHD